jgi:drug/metabolite transporter (DMT)-like permease
MDTPIPPRPAPAGLPVHGTLVLVQLLFATLAVAGKVVLRDLTPQALVALRLVGAALLLLLVRLVSPKGPPLARRDRLMVPVYALLGLVLNQVLFTMGLARTTATSAAVLCTSIPVFTFALGLLLGKERPGLRAVLGLLLGLGGALLLTGVDLALGADALWGDALIVLNSLSYAFYLVLSRGFFARYPTLPAVSALFFAAALGAGPILGRDLPRQLPTLPPATLWLTAYIVLMPTVGAYFLNAWALRRAPASLVSIYIYLQPVFGALLSAWLLHERPGPLTLVSALCIAAGVALVSRRPAA